MVENAKIDLVGCSKTHGKSQKKNRKNVENLNHNRKLKGFNTRILVKVNVSHSLIAVGTVGVSPTVSWA